MKEWFMAKSLTVKLLLAVVAVVVVAGIGTGIYLGVNKTKTPEPVVEVVSIGEDVVPATEAPDVEEVEEPEPVVTVTEPEEVEEEEEEVIVEPVEEAESYRAKVGNDFVNGNFAEGLYGYEVYAISEDNISYGTSANGFYVNIEDCGTEDWHVQLKQNDVRLVQGRWYRLTLDARSTVNRTITCVMQKNGTNDDNWTPYSSTMKMAVGNSWNTYSTVFRMDAATDNAAVFNVSMGAVDGVRVAAAHEVDLRNIKLELLPENFTDSLKGSNLIGNGNFAYGNILWEGSVVNPGQAAVSFDGNKATFAITNPGTEDWHVQLKQQGITLEKNTAYRLYFNVSSSVARTIKVGFMDTGYVNWYGGADLHPTADTQLAVVDFYNTIATDSNAVMMISMGQIAGEYTPGSVITLSDFKLVKMEGVVHNNSGGGSASAPVANLPGNWTAYDHEGTHTSAIAADGENGIRIDVTNTGSEAWHIQLTDKTLVVENGKTYKVSFDGKSTVERNITYMVQRNGDADNDWNTYSVNNTAALTTEWEHFEQTFTMSAATDNAAIYNFSLGYVDESSECGTHTIWIKNMTFEEVVYNGPEKTETGYLIKSTHDKTTDASGSKWVITLDPADYGIQNSDGKDITVSAKLKSDSYFGGIIGACYGDSWAWVDTGYVEGNADAEAEWKLDVDNFKGALQLQISEMAGAYVEVYDITMTVRENSNNDKWLIYANAESKGEQALNPEDFGISSPVGKNIKVTVKLLSSDDYCGSISGNDASEWNQTGEQRGAMNSDGLWEGTWTNTFNGYVDSMKIDIWWMGASTIEIVEVTMEEVPSQPAPSAIAVINNNSPLENGNIAVELPVDSSYEGKHVIAHITLESEGQFNGMVGGCNGDNWAWSQTEKLFGNAGTNVWDYEFTSLKGALKIFIYWREYHEDGDDLYVTGITFEEVAD